MFECLKSLMAVLVYGLLNEVRAWNAGAIKQKEAQVQKAHYRNIQNEASMQCILAEALKV